MIKFSEINDDYLEYDCLKDTSELINVEKPILKEFIKQDLAIFEYSRKIGKSISKLAIRKDSIIGQYLLSCEDEKKVINTSKYISYDKVVNAFNISIYSSDLEMSELIYPLFINKVEGTYQMLSNQYDLNAIDYIIDNPSFKNYLKDKRDTLEYTTCHVVYEDKVCLLRKLESKNKTLVKTNNNL